MALIPTTPVCITVAGKIDDPEFHICRVLAERLCEEYSPITIQIEAMVETDWELFIKDKQKTLERANNHKLSPIVFYNGCHYIGGTQEFATWGKRVYDLQIRANTVLYRRNANNAYRKYMIDSGMKYCFLDVQIGSAAPQRVVIELFSHICPVTCENFRALCTGEKGNGLHYKGTPFHRVVRNGWIQGGDIDGGHGDGGRSIYGLTFPDETYDVSHDRPGILSMATGLPHTNGSQFFITLQALTWLDRKRVAFGRVLSGMRVFRLIQQMEMKNQRPVVECIITDCGEIDLTPKPIRTESTLST